MLHPLSIVGIERDTANCFVKCFFTQFCFLLFNPDACSRDPDPFGRRGYFIPPFYNIFQQFFYPRFIRKQHLPSSFINNLTLMIHHIVVLKCMLAGIKVETFYLRLRSFQSSPDETVLYRLIFRNTETSHHVFYFLRAENPHQIILERYEKLRLSRIALAARASAELIINSARFMPFCA